jgi:hypothetical protein
MGSREKGLGGSISERRGNSCCLELTLQRLTNYKNALRIFKQKKINLLFSNTKIDNTE